MFIPITIFLFLIVPLVMLILYLVRPGINFQGFLAVLVVLAGWILVFLARPGLSQNIPLLQWQPVALFPLSPILVIDQSAWYFALALASLALSVVITSIAQLGQSPVLNSASPAEQTAVMDGSGQDDAASGDHSALLARVTPAAGWVSWALILVLTSLGIVAVTAGNLLTLLLAWSALDMIELVILLGYMLQSGIRERIILSFSAKLTGICLALVAGIVLWSNNASLDFESITKPASLLLLFAAGLRLGVLPIHLPFTRGLPINRNLGTMLRLVPAAASYILLVRLSKVGVTGIITPYLLALSILAGIYAAINWLRAKDEIVGRPYWLIASASLVVSSAILNQAAACLAWGIASLLSGGLIFSMSLRHKNLFPLIVLGLLNISTLPFSPTWQATDIYDPSSMAGLNPTLFAVFSLLLLLIQAFLLGGFIRQIMRGIYPAAEDLSIHAERWVWFLYPLGLVFIVLTHLLIGWYMLPNIHDVPLTGWFSGAVVVLVVGGIHLFSRQNRGLFQPKLHPNLRSAWDRLFALEWLYDFLWKLYRTASRIFALISSILEGDGGLLWALVLFGLIFVFLQRR